jgi:hypothetical protein
MGHPASGVWIGKEDLEAKKKGASTANDSGWLI